MLALLTNPAPAIQEQNPSELAKSFPIPLAQLALPAPKAKAQASKQPLTQEQHAYWIAELRKALGTRTDRFPEVFNRYAKAHGKSALWLIKACGIPPQERSLLGEKLSQDFAHFSPEDQQRLKNAIAHLRQIVDFFNGVIIPEQH